LVGKGGGAAVERVSRKPQGIIKGGTNGSRAKKKSPEGKGGTTLTRGGEAVVVAGEGGKSRSTASPGWGEKNIMGVWGCANARGEKSRNGQKGGGRPSHARAEKRGKKNPGKGVFG